jgi:hypothetical protein
MTYTEHEQRRLDIHAGEELDCRFARAYEREGENMVYGKPQTIVPGRTYRFLAGVGMVRKNADY